MDSMRGWALPYARKRARTCKVGSSLPRLQATHLGLSEIDEPSLRGCAHGLRLLAASHNELRALPDAIGTVPTPPTPHPLPPPAFGASGVSAASAARRFADLVVSAESLRVCVGKRSLHIALHAAWLHRRPSAWIARSWQLTRLEALLLDHNRLEALPAQIGALALLREVGARPTPPASTSAALEYCTVPFACSTVGPDHQAAVRDCRFRSPSPAHVRALQPWTTARLSTALVLVLAVPALQIALRST